MNTDAELIHRLQCGDLDALGLLYDQYRMTVYRTALVITRDPDASEDILQETFLRLHRFAVRFNAQLPVAPWLYRVAVNLSYTWISRRRRWWTPLEDFVLELAAPAQQAPESLFEQHDAHRRLQRALDALPPDQQAALILYYLNELSLPEIAAILDCPVGTVKSRLYYGRERLRQALTDSNHTSEVQYEFT
jgi:RNA polymerase sigma-70 factor (ECF subfamily)